MKYQMLEETRQSTFAVIFEKGDEFIGELTEFAKTKRFAASHFTAIGAFSESCSVISIATKRIT